MGCDIHTFVEIFDGKIWKLSNLQFPDYFEPEITEHPWDWRSYGMFAILAGVRNYSAIEPISLPRGLPKDISKELKEDIDEYYEDCHSFSYYYLNELLDFNWDKQIEDCRYTRRIDSNYSIGNATCEKGQGKLTTYREMLSEDFFRDIEIMKRSVNDPKDLRIVFFFDN